MPQWKPLHVHSGICLGKWKKKKSHLPQIPSTLPQHTHTLSLCVTLLLAEIQQLLLLSILDIKTLTEPELLNFPSISGGMCTQNGSLSIWSFNSLRKGKSFCTASQSVEAVCVLCYILAEVWKKKKTSTTFFLTSLHLTTLLCCQTIHRGLE